MMIEVTELEKAVMQYEGAEYISRAMPLYVALRRFMNHLETNYTDPDEMSEYLHAKAFSLDLQDRMNSEAVSDQLQ